MKPWITSGIRKSIKQIDKLLRKFIKTKNEELKEELYDKYKNIRNKIVSIIRASKKSHFQQYFIENGNDIKKNMDKKISSISMSAKANHRLCLLIKK